jgi:hypothetical protein
LIVWSAPRVLTPLADVGYDSKVFFIPPGWCLSTRLRSAQTWRG